MKHESSDEVQELCLAGHTTEEVLSHLTLPYDLAPATDMEIQGTILVLGAEV